MIPANRKPKLRIFVLLLAAACFLFLVRDHIWEMFGTADLGPVDFATLIRRATPNDALVCTASLCQARSDLESPIFAKPVSALRTALNKALASEPRITRVAANDAKMTSHYIQRSAVMHFPDTIDARLVGLPDGRSTILLYSRSKIGTSDVGVNRARLRRWLGKLCITAAAPEPSSPVSPP